VEQLTIWAKRIGVEIVRHQQGSDPAAVAYDACKAAVSRNVDYLILDTAGDCIRPKPDGRVGQDSQRRG
jgi:fused signal recognition particle receptor